MFRTSLLGVLATVVALGGASTAGDRECGMGPPCGPMDRAICPVEGININITASTPAVDFVNGQKLYFGSAAAATAYRESPKSFWLAPFDVPLAMPDGARGLPDLRNTTLRCPNSGEAMLISMASVRIQHKHGQNLFFCCYGCIAMAWHDPKAFFA